MKKTKSKKAISLLLSLLMVLSVFQMASVTAFAETEGDFEYYRSWNADEVSVTRYTGTSTEVTVPAELGGYPVVEVGCDAFRENETITKVVLPESVREIGDYAFYNCTALAEIDLPKDLSVIGRKAFYNTAYYNNESNWENDILYLDSYLLDTNWNLSGAQTVKNGTTLIANDAFADRGITGISFPESLVTVGEYAFQNCTDLVSVTFSYGLRTISPYAFYKCTSLQQAVLPESLRSIGYRAFESCTALQTVTVPAGVASMGDNIFYGCSALREMKGYTASKAEQYARQYGILFISIGMAEEKYSYAYTVLDDGASIAITDYYGAQTELTIPAELDGYTVTEIAENTFRDRPELTKITLPDTLQRIGKDAFFNTGYYNNAANWQENMLYIDQALISVPTGAAGEIAIREGTVLLADNAMYNCKKITAVTLPSTIRYIGDYAMTNCKAVAALNLPEGLLRLGKSALAGCKSIKTLYIPASLTDMDCEFEYSSNIPAAPFSECAGLTEISVASDHPIFSSVDGVLYNKNQTKLLQYPRAKKAASFSVPSSVTEMVYASFAMTSALQSVQIPDTITEIADCTFYEAASLQSISLPNSLTKIDRNALYSVGLRELTVPDSVTGKLYLDNCDSLQSLTVGNGITEMRVHDCPALVSVAVGENAHSIDFWALPHLQSITVSEKNTEYTSVNGVLYNKDKTVLEHYPAGKKDADLTIPEGVQTIYGVSSQYIKRIHIPASLETFNGVACPMLESISVADANPNYSAQDGVLFNKDKTELLLYPTKKSQTAYTVPSSVTTLANGAFNDAVYLESLVLPESITQIGTALSRCPALRAVHIPAGLTSLDSDAFLESTALESFTVAAENPNYVAVDGILFNKAKTELIRYPAAKTSTSYEVPQSVTQLVYGAFLGADALQSVTLPTNLKAIPASEFQNCTSLQSITIPTGVEVLESSAFLNCQALANVSLPSGVQRIEQKAFYGCTSLKTVKLPETLTYLGWASFSNSGLEEVFIPASVSSLSTEWDGTAFLDCTALKQITVSPDNPTYTTQSNMLIEKETGDLLQYALASPETELTIPDTVTNIGRYAFQNADLLETVTIPGTVKTVNSSAFFDCDALKNVVLSEGVKSIEGYAFVGCDSLQSIWIPRSVNYIDVAAFDFYMRPTSEKLIIYGYYGSTADAFARAYGYAFVDVSPRLQVPTDEKNGVIDVVLPQTTIQMVLDAVALQAEQEIIAVTVTEADGTVVTDYTALAQKGFVFTLTFADNSVSVYEIPAVTVGDVNGDDKINAVDARWVLQVASGIRTLDADIMSAADVNQDNKVNAVDARWILQVASGTRTL